MVVGRRRSVELIVDMMLVAVVGEADGKDEIDERYVVEGIDVDVVVDVEVDVEVKYTERESRKD